MRNLKYFFNTITLCICAEIEIDNFSSRYRQQRWTSRQIDISIKKACPSRNRFSYSPRRSLTNQVMLLITTCYSFDLFYRHIFISIDEHLRMKFVTEKKKKLKMKKENFYREWFTLSSLQFVRLHGKKLCRKIYNLSYYVVY